MSASCQSRHNAMRHLRRPEIACTKSLYFAQKALPWWSFMCKAPCGEGEEYSRKIGWQASGPLTRLARLCVLCVLATLSRKQRGCCGRAAPAFAPPACGTITTMRLSPHSPYHTAGTIDPAAFARFTIDFRIYARILTSPLQCWHRAYLHHTCSLMLPQSWVSRRQE